MSKIFTSNKFRLKITDNKITEERINVGLIGYGYWGKNLARVLEASMDFNLLYICDSLQEERFIAREKHGNTSVVADVNHIFNDNTVGAIVVATPVHTHFSLVEAALQKGKHVLCEKILARSTNEVQILLNLATQKKRVLDVDYTFLHNSVVHIIKRYISDNEVGTVRYLTFKRTNLGPFRSDVDVIEDLASHDLSILHFLMGKPDWVLATGADFHGQGLLDLAFIHLGYNNGTTALIQTSWINPEKQRIVEVIGTKGMLVFDDVNPLEKLKLIKSKKEYTTQYDDFGSFKMLGIAGDIIIPNILYLEPLREKISFFKNQILAGRNEIGYYQDTFSLTCAQLIEAIRESVDTGSVIKVPK